MVIVMIVIN